MRKNLFAILVAAGALVFALSLAGCSSTEGGSTSSSAATSTDGDGVVFAYNTEPQTNLIPSMVNEVGGGNILELIFEGLTRYDVDGTTQLAIAESITTADDGKTWNVKIKEGKKFSDGSPLTVQSFVDAWNWGANPENGALSGEFFMAIEGYPEVDDEGNLVGEFDGLTGLEVVSDTEFNITLAESDPEFDKQLGYSAFYPLPTGSLDSEDALEAQGTQPVSNGPYMLKSWDHNVQVELVPNPEYDGDIPAQNDGVTFMMYTDDSAAYNDLLAGNLDVLDSIPADAMSTFMDDLGDRAVNQDGAVWQAFTIPYYLEHFADDEEGRLRRQAISMAFDRQQICDTIFQGTRTPATDFVAAVIPGHSDSIEGNEVLQYNPEKAKELWAQANAISDWGNATFKLAYNADASAHKEWVEAVVNQIGQTLEISAEPEAYAQFSELRNDATNGTMTSALRSGWQADYPSAYNFMGPLYRANAGANDSRYDNPEFESVLLEARSQQDEAARTEGYNKAQAILMEDLPAIPLWGQNALGGYSEHVDNVVVNWKTVPAYQDIVKK
ncbi:MAG: ABC transporter substrate-binding protein [Eggerthellaceae bacterium]|nr:ABC transporter substrate-binding protein [Eggerthellaceae bacterium]